MVPQSGYATHSFSIHIASGRPEIFRPIRTLARDGAFPGNLNDFYKRTNGSSPATLLVDEAERDLNEISHMGLSLELILVAQPLAMDSEESHLNDPNSPYPISHFFQARSMERDGFGCGVIRAC